MGFLGFGRPDVERLAARGDIEGLVRAAKYKKDPELAEQARQALEDELGFLVASLGSRNIRHLVLSREAVRLIGQPAVDLLLDVLVKGDTTRRCDAAVALGEIGLPSAVPGLQKALRDDNAVLRICCVRALAEIDDPKARSLVERARRDRDEQVRRQAEKALAKVEKRQK